ncbi:MAG: cadmium-translocating P-type ATPase [Oscillospiraceae bacterium]|jgi:Cd2+/Zn2+-exporting ATPase|nr:cadmium-translocating P-type ATPase [Oscillospiraceae bacterium]
METENKRTLLRLLIGAAFLIPALLIPLGEYFGEKSAFWIEIALYLIPYIIIGADVLRDAATNLVRGKVFDEKFLMTIATLGVFALALAFKGEGDYIEAVAVMLFYEVGELCQDLAVDRSRDAISALMDIRPDSATVLREGALVTVSPEAVKVGEALRVLPGERIALDGVILEGESLLDMSALTGESLPRAIKAGEAVLSGGVNLSGALTIETTKLYGESTVARILELAENSLDKKAKTESFITRFARIYTPAVCALALALAVAPPLLGGLEWAIWIKRALIFLVVSCPCALVISVPMGFFAGIGGASRRGILVKGGSFLEALSRLDTVVFDKTGTLTTGRFAVTMLFPEGVSERELLETAALAESGSLHPIARSIIEALGEEPSSDGLTDVRDFAGRGVSASFHGDEIAVGSAKLLRELGVAAPEGGSLDPCVFVAKNGVYLGRIAIADALKPDAGEAFSRLRELGINKLVILTGDSKAASARVAEELRADEVHAQLLPQDKVAEVERLLAEQAPGGALAFVGDGVNDAPVLARADVGIAMGGIGSDAALEAADVVIMDDKPSALAVGVTGARRTMAIVRQNIFFALGVKFLVLGLAAFGIAGMWLAIFADVGVSMIAIMNAMRALKY